MRLHREVSKLRPRLWGEHFHDGRRWSDRANGATRGFCKLVLQPLREIYGVLEAPSETGMERLRDLDEESSSLTYCGFQLGVSVFFLLLFRLETDLYFLTTHVLVSWAIYGQLVLNYFTKDSWAWFQRRTWWAMPGSKVPWKLGSP